ncbi:MAG TPA: hypothetical protein ENI68_05830, partial [Gammaproteobacteria bacterium]|nr:hypothetical protein [Gammaproteobacteria bacterium]
TLILSLAIATTGYAASDLMVSLFKFQSKMVAQGNVEAIMKLGEMYEQGRGTKKDFNKALEMYKKALAQGHADAAKAIRRVETAKKQGVRNLEIERKKKLSHEKSLREKAARAQVARDEAARQEAAREKIMREEAAMEKIMHEEAAMEKAAHEEVEKEKIMRRKMAGKKIMPEKTAMKKAVHEEVTGGKVMPEKAAMEKTARGEVGKEKAIKAGMQQKPEKKAPGMGWDEEDPEDPD